MHVGGHVKPKNVTAERVDRRIAENQTGKRIAVMTLRQRDGRTISAAVLGEPGDVAWQLVKNHVEKDAELRTDENPAYDELAGLNAIVRNNRCVAFVSEPGASTRSDATSPAFAGPKSGSITTSRASTSTGTRSMSPGARIIAVPTSRCRRESCWARRWASRSAGTWQATGSAAR
jgi:hypothetical protein